MDLSEPKSITVPELALIAATRGAIGFGAGLLLAGKIQTGKAKGAGLDAVFIGAVEHDSDRDGRVR